MASESATMELPTRPMSVVELSNRKYDLLNRYNDPQDAFNDPINRKMMRETLYYTPDEAKLGAVAEKAAKIVQTKDASPWGSLGGGEQVLSDWDALEQKMAEGWYPLGGLQNGLAIEKVQLKDTMDTNNSSFLIPQGIVPNLFVWLATRFQAWTQFDHVPANGPVHSWRNLIDFGDVEANAFIDEDGCPAPGRGVYTSGSTNIAILAFRRQQSLRLRLLEQQIGFRYDGQLPSERELSLAMISRSRILEKVFYQGTTVTAHTGTDEYGKTFANGFNGWRVLLSNTTAANLATGTTFYPSGFTPVVTEQSTSQAALTPITDAFDAAIAQIYNNGGIPDRIHMTVSTALKLKQENASRIRYIVGSVNDANITVGGKVASFVSAVVGEIPITIVMDQSIGTYTAGSVIAGGGATTYASSASDTTAVVDGYVFTSSDVAFPYIGSEDPLPIETPDGVYMIDNSGTLSGCMIRALTIYLMTGLACYVPIHQAKVRLLA